MLTNEPDTVCSACGFAPQPGKKLLRCSRCHGAFYHDRECQKKHFPSHRKACRPAASSPSLCYKVEKADGQGRFLVATRSIDAGESLPNSTDPKSTLFQSVVRPVLLAGTRRTHCALCFGLRDKESISLSDCPKYEVVVCSKCLPEVDSKRTLRQEASTISRLVDTANELHGENNMKVLPTAVLVFRILSKVAKGLAWDTILTMQTHDVPPEVPEHSLAVQWTVSQLLHMTEQYSPSLEAKIQPTLHRIRYNSFAITDPDGDAIGIGLYGTPAHLLNHSCRPNARQCFVNGTDLKISTIEPIQSGEEITIAYGDVDRPVSGRKDQLYKDYNFHCNCRRCSEELNF